MVGVSVSSLTVGIFLSDSRHRWNLKLDLRPLPLSSNNDSITISYLLALPPHDNNCKSTYVYNYQQNVSITQQADIAAP